MLRAKKGLSDVVTTVLIILLVVAAVVTIWAFIQPTLKNAGTSIQKGQVCLTNSIEPITCKFTNIAGSYNATIGFKQNTDVSVIKGVNALNFNFELDDGSLVSRTEGDASGGVSAPGSGLSSTAYFNTTSGSLTKKPKSVSISSDYSLVSGTAQTCSSTSINCEAA